MLSNSGTPGDKAQLLIGTNEPNVFAVEKISGKENDTANTFSYLNLNNNTKAIETCDLVIKNYPSSSKLPGAYYRKGQALKNMKRIDEARNAFQYVVTTYPTSDEMNLAKTQLMSTEFTKKP